MNFLKTNFETSGFQRLPIAAAALALSFLLFAVPPLPAQAPIAEIKLSFKRVNEGSARAARQTGDVSGAWSATSKSGYLILREDAGKLTDTVGRSEQAESPISDLDFRDGVVRFTLG
jgi:hypothetical protein